MKSVSSTIWESVRKLQLRVLTIAVTMLLGLSSSYAMNYGHIWIADKYSSLIKMSAETGAVELTLPILEEKDVHLVLDDKRDILWLGREHGPLFAYDANGALIKTIDLNALLPELKSIDSQEEHDDDDMDEFEIEHMLVDKRDGSLWLALEHHIIRLSSNGEILLNMPTSKEVKEIALDIGDNAVWLSTEHSVYSIDADTGYIKVALVLPPKSDDTTKTAEVEDLAFDMHLNELWVMTEKQLLRYKRDGTLVLNKAGFEPVIDIIDETIQIKKLKDISIDGKGNLWMLGKNDLYRVSQAGIINLSLPLDKSKHYNDSHRNLVANVNDHSIWLINKKNITHVFTDGTSVEVFVSTTNIESVTINGDVNAPVLSITAPTTDVLVPRRPEIKLGFDEIGVGVNISSIKLKVNDVDVAATCSGDLLTATCIPDTDLLDETLTLSLTVEDNALNLSNVASVTVKLDSDGDGVPDSRDTYPEDPTRWRLAAVTGTQTALNLQAVKVNWAQHVDPANTKGYLIYRTQFGQAETKLTPAPLTTLEYIDANVTNGTGYSYRVVAVDTRDYEGEPGTVTNFFVAYNYIPVVNLTTKRNPVAALLNWQTVPGMRYQLYRAEEGADAQPLIQLVENTASYTDHNTLWNKTYTFQVSTLADFVDVFTNLPVVVEGPVSAPVTLAALPPLGLKVYDAYSIGQDSFELTLLDPDTMSITGAYTEATGPVSVTATATNGTVKSQERSDGKFNLLLPVAQGLNWTIAVSELTVPDRTTTLSLTLKEDKEAPTITIDGEANPSVDTDSILISGTAVDIGIGVREVYLTNNRFAGQEFGSILAAGDTYSAQIPLESGENLITVTAVDRMGNQATAQTTVTLRAAVIPKISILSPQTGSAFYNNAITVTGEVYTQQAADQIKITLGNQQVFPTQSSALDTYSFSFSNVKLNEGYNPIVVTVDTPAGKAETSVIVSYSSTPPAPEVTPAPVITVSSPRETSFVNANSIIVSGDVNSQAGISSVTVAGQAVSLTGQSPNYKTFQYEFSLAGIEGQTTVDVVATDILNQVTTKTLTITNDTTAPVIAITTPGIVLPAAVNNTNEMPYKLQGTVADNNLRGFSINGTPVSLLPGATAGSYEFAVDLNLPAGAGQIVSLDAWDGSGNRSSQEIIFDVSLPVDIEIISPRDKAEIASSTYGASIEVVARLTGMEAGFTAQLVFNADAAVDMNRDGNVANLGIQTALNSGEQNITVQILDTAQQVVSSRSISVSLKNIENIPLAVERTEPDNGARDIDPNERINVYFNQAIDPALLQIQVHETVHGKTYDLASQQGKGMGELTLPGLVDIHKEMEALAGSLSQYPGNRYSSFNPAALYHYNADIFVTVNYNNAELHRFNFKVKPVPTIISGMVRDQLGEAIEGVEVMIPEFELSAVTNEKGNFILHSEKAGKPVKAGRYSIIYNPDMAKAIYGTATNEISVQLGNINDISTQVVPLLNPGIAFSYVRSNQNPTVLASGNLELDLSAATLTYPNGRDNGNLHVQFAKVTELGFNTMKEATPYWMYAVQPAGIEVRGEVGVKIQMPILFGSYDYVPANGTLVVMLGFNSDSKIIEPVGVGRIENNVVTSVGKLSIQTMDYFGYAMVQTEHQPILERFANGETGSIDLFKSELVQAISN